MCFQYTFEIITSKPSICFFHNLQYDVNICLNQCIFHLMPCFNYALLIIFLQYNNYNNNKVHYILFYHYVNIISSKLTIKTVVFNEKGKYSRKCQRCCIFDSLIF